MDQEIEDKGEKLTFHEINVPTTIGVGGSNQPDLMLALLA